MQFSVQPYIGLVFFCADSDHASKIPVDVVFSLGRVPSQPADEGTMDMVHTCNTTFSLLGLALLGNTTSLAPL